MKTFLSLHRNIKIRLLTSFISRFVGNMVFPFMAIYFAEEFGAATAGLLLLLNVIASVATSLFGGYVSDRYGRKKVMVIAQTIQILSFTVMACVNSPWFLSAEITFCMMLVQSISSGLMNPAAEAMLIDVSTRENRPFMYSVNYWSVNLSIAAGTILGGLFFNSHRFALFVILAVTSIFVFVLLTGFMKESRERTGGLRTGTVVSILKDMGSNYRLVMTDKRFLIFSLAHLLVLSLEFQMNNYIAIRLEREFQATILGVFSIDGLQMLSWMRVENTVLIVVFTLFVTQWMKRYRPMHVLFIGLILYVSGYTAASFSNQWLVLIIAMIIVSLGELMYVPICQSLVATLAKDDFRGSYMAVYGFVFQGAKVMGSLGVIAGAFLPSFMMAGLFLVMGSVGICFFYFSIRGVAASKARTV